MASVAQMWRNYRLEARLGKLGFRLDGKPYREGHSIRWENVIVGTYDPKEGLKAMLDVFDCNTPEGMAKFHRQLESINILRANEIPYSMIPTSEKTVLDALKESGIDEGLIMMVMEVYSGSRKETSSPYANQ